MAERRRYTVLLVSLYEFQRHLLDTDRERNFKKELLTSGGHIAIALAALEIQAKTASAVGGRFWTRVAAPIFALQSIYLGGAWVSYQIGGDEGTAQFNQFLNLTATQPAASIEVTLGSIIAVTQNPKGVQKVAKDVKSGYQELAKRYEPLTSELQKLRTRNPTVY